MNEETKFELLQPIFQYVLNNINCDIVKKLNWKCVNLDWCENIKPHEMSACMSGIRINALISLILPIDDNLNINIFEAEGEKLFCFCFIEENSTTYIYFPVYANSDTRLLLGDVCRNGKTTVENSTSKRHLAYTNYADDDIANINNMNNEEISKYLKNNLEILHSNISLIDLRYFEFVMEHTIGIRSNKEKLKRILISLLLLRPDLQDWLNKKLKSKTNCTYFYTEIKATVQETQEYLKLPEYPKISCLVQKNIIFSKDILDYCGLSSHEINSDSFWRSVSESISNKTIIADQDNVKVDQNNKKSGKATIF